MLALIYLLFGTLTYSAGKKEYMSPDGAYLAVVVTDPASGESKVVVKTKDGRMICSRSFLSEDREHGAGVDKTAWTPDSRFFVYGMYLSGGHQPWHFPAEFCSVRQSITRRLDDYVGPVISSTLKQRLQI